MEEHNVDLSCIYHTQGIVGFQHYSFQYSEGKMIQCLKRKEFRCPKCFHCSVSARCWRTRRIPKTGISKALERTIVEFRPGMTIHPDPIVVILCDSMDGDACDSSENLGEKFQISYETFLKNNCCRKNHTDMLFR